ncbi:MAG: hypothetical protein KDE53_10530 [Caldilineaceae bacterium]|nr:hypothetical protein [Caldilineaceae bacterium]
MRGPYETPDVPCPYCGEMCSAEFVDVGVGMVQCGPYHCEVCGAIEIGVTTMPNRELTELEKETGWLAGRSIGRALLTPLQEKVRNMFAGLVATEVIEASDHPYRCKCQKCLQWWLAVGPEDTGLGWSFGPFTEEEFVAAGGVVPEYEVPA